MPSETRVKSLLIAATISTVLFSALSLLFVQLNVFSFSTEFKNDMAIGGLPVLCVIYNFVYSLFALGFYLFLNRKFPDNTLERYSLSLSNVILGLCLAIGFFGYAKLFTIINVGLVFMLLIFVEYINTTRFMYRFYRAFFLLLIPIWFVRFVMIGREAVQYNVAEQINIKVWTVPVEHFFYGFALMLCAVLIFEKLRRTPLR